MPFVLADFNLNYLYVRIPFASVLIASSRHLTYPSSMPRVRLAARAIVCVGNGETVGVIVGIIILVGCRGWCS